MKNAILTLLLFAISSFAQGSITKSKKLEFVGDSAAKVYYPLACDEALHINAKNYVPLFSKEDADGKGFKLAAKCSKAKAGMSPRSGSAERPAPTSRKLWKIVLATTPGDLWTKASDPQNLLDLNTNFTTWKLHSISVWARLRITTRTSDAFNNSHRGVWIGFYADDGTDTFYVYMIAGAGSKALQEYLINNVGDDDGWALISIIPVGCNGEGCDAELHDYQVFAKINRAKTENDGDQ